MHKCTLGEDAHNICAVVAKNDKRVKDFIIGLSQHYVGEETKPIMMSVIKSFFDNIYELCVNVSLTLTKLEIGNVGVRNENGQDIIVILDAERVKPMAQTDDKWQLLAKTKATKIVSAFFKDFAIQTPAASA